VKGHVEAEGPVTLFTRHVIVPAAIIAMVTAFLFYLLEVRSVLAEGGGEAAFKQVGLCFAAATVLIARYGRGGGDESQQGCYTAALAIATLLFMAQRSGPLGFVLNILIVAAVWRFATGVTGALSLERELGIRKELELYGIARLRFETFRQRQQEEKGAAWMSRWNRRRQEPDAHGNPVSAVARLAALALLGFAVGEPFLLRAAPEIAERALADVIVFLFATGLVLAAGSAAGTLRHTLQQGGRVAPGVLPARVAVAALLSIAVLAAALAIPGVRFRGQGGLRATSQRGATGPWESQTDGRQSSAARDGKAPPDRSPDGEPALGAGALVNVLGSLGRLLRLPLLAAVALLALFALSRLRHLLPSASDLWARLAAWLRRPRPERKPRPALRDPFAGLAALATLPPRDAVLAAYARLLLALDNAGHPRPERATPYEHLSALPARLRPVSKPVQALTDLYVLAAYGDEELSETDRDRALTALGEVGALSRKGASGIAMACILAL
jgi:hypothetical protein